jgi:hypothetical protein
MVLSCPSWMANQSFFFSLGGGGAACHHSSEQASSLLLSKQIFQAVSSVCATVRRGPAQCGGVGVLGLSSGRAKKRQVWDTCSVCENHICAESGAQHGEVPTLLLLLLPMAVRQDTQPPCFLVASSIKTPQKALLDRPKEKEGSCNIKSFV